jgi:hypothetical protein
MKYISGSEPFPVDIPLDTIVRHHVLPLNGNFSVIMCYKNW